jgi:dipeptidyl aminopeptidase/acylaminoacyl peptidase
MSPSGAGRVARVSGWLKFFFRVSVIAVCGLGFSPAPGLPQFVDIFLPITLPPVRLPIPSVPLNETVLRVPMTVPRAGGVQRLHLEATLYRPSGPGPFPLLVLSHGTCRDPRQRAGRRLRYDAQSWEFVSMGFAVVIPMRRGYGHSEGAYAENEGVCDHSHFYRAGLESAKDLRATVEYVSHLPGIDRSRLVLAGHSSGGFASLILASQRVPGVRGVINFADGRGSSPRRNCSPDKLIEACARAGRTTRVPSLWIYAQNDTYFPPPLAREMCDAYRRAGAPVEFVLLPPFSDEGHYLFRDVRGLRPWTPVVNRFLNGLGFPGSMPRP